MRQNGLRASSFVPVVDVDPRVADQLLDLLRLADVAAYSEPAPGSTGVYRDHHVSRRRLDRLWVDRAETLRARGVLDRALPHLQAELEVAIRDGVVIAREPGAGDLIARPTRAVDPVPGSDAFGRANTPVDGAAAHSDRAAHGDAAGAAATGTAAAAGSGSAAGAGSAETVADGGLAPAARSPLESAEPAAPEAVTEISGADQTAPRSPRGPLPGHDGGQPPTSRRRSDDAAVEESWAQIVAGFDTPVVGPAPWPSVEDLPGPRITRLRRPVRPMNPVPAADADDDEHFVPPPPQTLPRLDPLTRLGWAAVIGGPVLLVLVVLFGHALPAWVPLVGVLILVGGFGLLVSRLRPSNDDGSDHHDGAVV